MERYKTYAQTSLRYELQGDYYLITGEDDTERPAIGIWGLRHLRWLKQNRRVTYTNLLTTGRLYDYLQIIDTQANELFELLIRQMAKAEGITEQMKTEDQMKWVRQMNNISQRAAELSLCGLHRIAGQHFQTQSPGIYPAGRPGKLSPQPGHSLKQKSRHPACSIHN